MTNLVGKMSKACRKMTLACRKCLVTHWKSMALLLKKRREKKKQRLRRLKKTPPLSCPGKDIQTACATKSNGRKSWPYEVDLPEFYLPVQRGAATLQTAQKLKTPTFRAAKPQDERTLLQRCPHTNWCATYTKQLDGTERRNRELVTPKSVGAKEI